MNKDLLEEIRKDTELAKTLSVITDREALLDLESRMIGYMQMLQDNADEYEYKSTQLRNKSKILKEYIRTIHSRRTELSVSDSLTRKGI